MRLRQALATFLCLLLGLTAWGQADFDPELRLRAVSLLRKGMASDEFWPSMHAAEALTAAGFGACVIYDLLPRLAAETDDQKRCGLSREIMRAGDLTPLPGMVKILKDPDTSAPVHVCESLFKVHQVGDLAAMRAHLESEATSEELMAAAALVRAGQATELARIRRYLLPPNEETPRRIAAWILGQVGTREDWPAIRQLAESAEDPLASAFAWNALAKLENEKARERVLANLASDDKTIRTYSAQTLGICGLPTQLPALAKALDDANPDTAIRAAEAIVRITGRLLEQDSDGDSIPDCIEALLGTPSADAEVLTRFYEAKPKGPGTADPEALPGEIVGAWFGHVGGDRYLWIYEFGSAFSEQRTVFHSYVRLDEDDTTGRQGGGFSQGVDVMYSFVDARNDPRIFTHSLRTNTDWPVRGVVAGSRIYVCDDVTVAQADGKASIRVHLLSERYPNARTRKKVGRSTPLTTVTTTLRANRALPELDYPKTIGFEAIEPNYTLRYQLRYHPKTVQLTVSDAEGTGFIRHHNGDIESRSATVGEVELPVPVSGRYRVAFYGFASGAGRAGLQLTLAGEPIGAVAVGRVSKPGSLLFSKKLKLLKGDVLKLQTARRGAGGRFGDFMLIKVDPELPELQIANLRSAVLPARPGEAHDRVEVVWTTNWAVTCDVVVEQAARKHAFETSDETGVNHRFELPATFAGRSCKVTITTRATDRLPSVSGSVMVKPGRPTPKRSARKPGRVRLEVAESVGTGRKAWPVTSGVPFAEGTLADGARCRVLDSTGKPLAAQFRELSLWPDGSVKWLLVDTLVTTTPGAKTELSLETNVDPAEYAGVRVAESAEGIELDTGALTLALSRDRFEPFARVAVDGRTGAAPGALTLVDAEGRVFTSAGVAPDEIVVEESGPVRATVRVRGTFADTEGNSWMRYLCRLHVYAGQAWVRLEITFENSALTPKMSVLSRLELPLLVKDLAGITSGQGTCKALLQDYDNRFLIDGKAHAGRSAGYCAVLAKSGPAVVAIRDFWQLYPKAFEARGDGSLVVGVLPPLPKAQYQNEADQRLVDRLYYWCDDGGYKLRSGMRFTTEIAVGFDPGVDPGAFNGWVQNPLFAAASTQHYCASGVLGNLVPRKPKAFTRYESDVDKAFIGFMERRESKREYGFMNFGDWYGERTWNWGNVEYDTQFALGLHFMRTGSLAALARADEAAFHNGDVDTVHYASDPRSIGRAWVHCLGHTGGYFPPEFKNMGGFATGARGAGHTWCRGHFLLWALTGNERYREAGEKVAHYQAVVLPRNVGLGTHRDGGWTLIGALGAYQVNGDPFYLNGARVLLERVLDKQRPNGQWGHTIWECRDVFPRPWGCKPFMSGVVLHALAMLDRVESTPRAQDAIRRGASYLWEKTYVPDQHGFIYAEAPRFQGRGGIWTLALAGDGLARACNYDRKHRDKPLLLDALSHTMYRGGVNSFGKNFTQGLCFMPFMLAELTELGIENPPRVYTPPELRLRSHVILPPGESMIIRPALKHSAETAEVCRISFAPEAAEFLGGKHVFEWQAEPGWSLGPEIRVTVPAQPGVSRFAVSASVGEKHEERELVLEAVGPTGAVGSAVGWVTAAKDHFAIAAKAVGVGVTPIPDLAKVDLQQLGTLVLGAEAHEKNYAGCRAVSAEIARFVINGGTLIVGQVNDANWKPDYLPRDVIPGDDGTEAGQVLEPRHAIFANLNNADLAGTQSFDRFEWVAPAWKVLVKAKDGTPSILETTLGKGRILVVMPSFDRAAVADEGAQSGEAARALIKGLLGMGTR